MRIGILCNGRDVAAWQLRAIEQITPGNELFLLVCGDGRSGSRALKHAFYYALNIAAIRNRATRAVPFPNHAVPIAGTIAFEPLYDGAWAVLPNEALDWVRAQQLDAIVKFGLNLLRVPEDGRLKAPILSYHHGDPRSYRGRPAGFYELLSGEKFMGQIVQIIGNKLDAGAVLAFAETRVVSHSYRKTLLEALHLSPFLLPKALEALRQNQTLPLDPKGRNYRLPGNLTVLRFLALSLRNFIRRVAYGAFVEKRWNVATATAPAAADPVAAIAKAGEEQAQWSRVPLIPPYSFYADPFFHSGADDIFVEGLNSRSGKGELVRIGSGGQQRITGFSGHVSYPGTVEEGGRLYLVPETSDWARPAVYGIEGNSARKVADLDLREEAILDPTLMRHEGRLYLFGNRAGEGASVLRLWSAASLFGRFEEHPASPIRVSARGSRMAGALMQAAGGLYRLGQDFRHAYGDGILAFRVERIDEQSYLESEAGEAAFSSVRGPHTVNLRDGRLLFDWYLERRSLLAGVRRLLNKL